MFDKVLIANRGAIATRAIRTLKKLGVQSVSIYAESDRESLHVRDADEAYSLGEGGAKETYLNVDKILSIAMLCGAQAIFPGYGFLSENAEFVERCEQNDIAFVGPTAEQITLFGLKHTARELALKAQVPLSPGSGLLNSVTEALEFVDSIGYPVMLKTTAGGGGIGMQLCHTENDLKEAFDSVRRLGGNNFSNDGVFVEKYIANARHIEVQIFADGQGGALAIGERDCSSQRRNQKVIEECPAPHLSARVREQLHQTAESLLASVNYRNAGTVEFIYDKDADQFYFLEVNTRLQVEHGVTEEVFGIDLVEWMLRLASGEKFDLQQQRDNLSPSGHALQVRIYAEDPFNDFQPAPGLLSAVRFPQSEHIRVDYWVDAGVDVSPFFDPMLAKVIVHGADRNQVLQRIDEALDKTVLYGCVTNLEYLRALLQDEVVVRGEVTTRYLNQFAFKPSRMEVLHGGTQTTIQDFPGRRGFWHVGVPPSGPFDNLSFRLANRLLNNADDAAGLEITLQGPHLRFHSATQVVIAGASIDATLDGDIVPMWQVIDVCPGQTLVLGKVQASGARCYLAVLGGIDCPAYLDSRSTFTLGQFGGHNGRVLRTGDVLSLPENPGFAQARSLPKSLQPEMENEWELRVIYGPHGAPDFFTQDDIDLFFSHAWEVHYNSSRTGIRLIGPKPKWARANGGEAGLHPSNIHDNAYAFGTVDFTGDMPVILGPDGPSLGGFVCPATVITADLWKLGQLRAGDKIRFISVSLEQAVALEAATRKQIHALEPFPIAVQECSPKNPIVDSLSAQEVGVDVIYRIAGDHFLLVEYGELELDIELRFRAHALMQWLEKNTKPGIFELTPGIRSLQIHYDSQKLNCSELLGHLKEAEFQLASQLNQLSVPSRIVHIPLSWDDEACRLAIEKYDQSVRKDAPWSPSNLEFIRRINGLDSLEDVKNIVFDAAYLVMGLGDVYLGAPVATPVDPRHRLVTTKYNPARTWTAENSVGIGGSYLCVYGMEGPGGYQFVGRTLQMWNRYRQTREFDEPWLLRFFDQIRFYPVDHDELEHIRKDFPLGRYPIKIEQAEFNLGEYKLFLQKNDESIANFKAQRESAFEQELAHWHASGQFNFSVEEQQDKTAEISWGDDHLTVESPVSGSVWQFNVTAGQHVQANETLLVLESMKTEIPVCAPQGGVISQLIVKAGQQVRAGDVLVVFEKDVNVKTEA